METRGYVALYNGRRIELHASSAYAAQRAAVVAFKAPKGRAHLVSVHLVEVDGEAVVATAVD